MSQIPLFLNGEWLTRDLTRYSCVFADAGDQEFHFFTNLFNALMVKTSLPQLRAFFFVAQTWKTHHTHMLHTRAEGEKSLFIYHFFIRDNTRRKSTNRRSVSSPENIFPLIRPADVEPVRGHNTGVSNPWTTLWAQCTHLQAVSCPSLK